MGELLEHSIPGKGEIQFGMLTNLHHGFLGLEALRVVSPAL